MRRWTILVLAAALVLGATCPGGAAEPAKIKALLITGDDVAPAHNWREISETTRQALVASGKFDVKVCEEPLILESKAALDGYDVIVFTAFTRSMPTLSPAALANLSAFVDGGKGFYVQHLASASFGKTPEFGKLCGRYWVMGKSGHGPRSVFTAKVVKEHPITQGLSDFQTDDELYAKLQGEGPITVLVEADSDWSKKTEPLVFVREQGKGRVVQNAFGHDAKALQNPNVTKLIVRGVEWAATGK